MEVTFHHPNCILFIISESPGPAVLEGLEGGGYTRAWILKGKDHLGPSQSLPTTLFLGKTDRQNFPVPQSWPSDWVLANRTRTEWCLPFSESFLLPPAYRHGDLGNSMLKMAKPKSGRSIRYWIRSWIREEGTLGSGTPLWTWNQQVTFYHLWAIISLGITAAGLIFSNIPVRLWSRKCHKDEGPAVCEKAERERQSDSHGWGQWTSLHDKHIQSTYNLFPNI